MGLKLSSSIPAKQEPPNWKMLSGFPSGPAPMALWRWGLSHILIRDGLYDSAFAEDWTLGFEEFKTYVEEFTPEYVSGITGIAEDRIERLAEDIADAEGASYIMYTGLEYTKSGVQNIRAVMVLRALAGQLDVEGGRCFLEQENFLPLPTARQLETPGFDKSIGAGKFPVYSHYCGGEPHASLLPKAIIDGDPYKIRGLFVMGASLITCWPNSDLWKRAMESAGIPGHHQSAADGGRRLCRYRAARHHRVRAGILLLLRRLPALKGKTDRTHG